MVKAPNPPRPHRLGALSRGFKLPRFRSKKSYARVGFERGSAPRRVGGCFAVGVVGGDRGYSDPSVCPNAKPSAAGAHVAGAGHSRDWLPRPDAGAAADAATVV